MFCYASDVIYYDFVNLLNHEGKMYVTKLNEESNSLKKLVKEKLSSNEIDEDCNYLEGDFSLNLYVNSGDVNVFLDKDKVCNMLIALPLETDVILFER